MSSTGSYEPLIIFLYHIYIVFLGKKLTEDELNSLIAHAHRRIEQLQKQLAEQIALEQVRIQQSMEQQRKEDEKLTDQRVSDEQEKLKNSFLLQKEREVIINHVSNMITTVWAKKHFDKLAQ